MNEESLEKIRKWSENHENAGQGIVFVRMLLKDLDAAERRAELTEGLLLKCDEAKQEAERLFISDHDKLIKWIERAEVVEQLATRLRHTCGSWLRSISIMRIGGMTQTPINGSG